MSGDRREEPRPDGEPARSGLLSSEEYLSGIDLFDRGCYFEAHEAWEARWRSSPPGSVDRAFLKALIQLASGAWKARAAAPGGGSRLLRSALALLEGVRRRTGRGRHAGLDLARIESIARAALAGEPPPGPLLLEDRDP